MEKYNIVWNKYNEEKDYIIGYLCHNEGWIFFYNQKIIEEAIKKGFRPFPEFPNIYDYYCNVNCFATFKNRLNKNILTDNISCYLDEGDNYEKSKCKNLSHNWRRTKGNK